MELIETKPFRGLSAKYKSVKVFSDDQPDRCTGIITFRGGFPISFTGFIRVCAFLGWSWSEVRHVLDQLSLPIKDKTIDAQHGDGTRARRNGKLHHGSIPSLPKQYLQVLEDARMHLSAGPTINKVNGDAKGAFGLTPEEADTEAYTPQAKDNRPLVERQIRERRGQQAFRDALRIRYGDICLVTGCELLAVLEAAHIVPYRGQDDHHPENGLLLRSDIHTLFDLDLISIGPDSLKIELHPNVVAEYGDFNGRKLLCSSRSRPSRSALQKRYEQFSERLSESC
jgi:hypothetical protein